SLPHDVYAQDASAARSLPAKPPQVNAAEDIPKPDFEGGKDTKPSPPPATATLGGPTAPSAGPEPFGSRLFTGNFLKTRQDGLNPDYVVMPGDRVMVNTWGAVEM